MPTTNPDIYEITTALERIDIARVHEFLAQSYWSPGIPLQTVERALQNSLCFGVLHTVDGFAGFARLVTDRATFAYLADLFIMPAHRGRGLSKRLMAEILAHREVQGLRRWMLATRDAHGLYARFGFQPLNDPSRLMTLHRPHIYTQELKAPASP